MASVFDNLNYIDALRKVIDERRKQGSKLTFAWLSEQAGLQKTYVSKVFQKGAHLNSDQLFSFCEALNLGSDETDFLLLLLEFNRSTNAARSARLREQIRSIQEQRRNIKKYSSATQMEVRERDQFAGDYYHDPTAALVYAFLMIPKYAADLEKLRKKVEISESHLKRILNILTKLDLISYDGSSRSYLVRNSHIHLEKGSSLSQVADILKRQQFVSRIGKLEPNDYFSYTLTFSADESSKHFIHDKLLKLVKESESKIKEAPCESVYQLQLGLAPF